MSVFFRWLGAAGLELKTNGEVLLVDPYLTRIPMWKIYFGRIQPDPKAIQSIEKCDYLLITHSHFDHLLDAPPVVSKTGAIVSGSYNTRRLLGALGVSPDLIQSVHPGDNLFFDEFEVRVFPFEHARVPGFGPGGLPQVLKPPLKTRDYRMDFGCCYRIAAGGVTFLTDPGFNPAADMEADVLFIQPFHDAAYYKSLLDRTTPKLVVPIHWDNLFRRGDKKPYFMPPRLAWLPLKRVNLEDFTRTIKKIMPDVEVLVPEPFKTYETADIL